MATLLRLSKQTFLKTCPTYRILHTPLRFNHYNTLGIARTATKKEIRSAFKSKSIQCHPDRFPGNAAKEQQFKKLSEAYQTLNHESWRRTYDARIFNISNSYQKGGHNMHSHPPQDTSRMHQRPDDDDWFGDDYIDILEVEEEKSPFRDIKRTLKQNSRTKESLGPIFSGMYKNRTDSAGNRQETFTTREIIDDKIFTFSYKRTTTPSGQERLHGYSIDSRPRRGFPLSLAIVSLAMFYTGWTEGRRWEAEREEREREDENDEDGEPENDLLNDEDI